MFKASEGFPRLYAAASLKHGAGAQMGEPIVLGFSAALCRGLIEASCATSSPASRTAGFPRLYAAASLKQSHRKKHIALVMHGFPRLYAAASLKRSVYAGA